MESFGLGATSTSWHPRWTATDIEYGPDGTRFTVVHDEDVWGHVHTPLPGAFNVRNCLAAIAAAESVEADRDAVREALGSFRSVRRRLELRGEPGGIIVIDDFAHHPTEVRGTLAAVRQLHDRPITAVFEPRSYTAQLRTFQEDYRNALGGADQAIIAGLFHPERYDETTGLDPEELARSLAADGTPARYIPDTDHIVATLAAELEPGDLVLVMSNGGFGGIHDKLLEALAASERLQQR